VIEQNRIVWLTLATLGAFTLHNAEEVLLGLPAWMTMHNVGFTRIDESSFLIAATLVTAVGWVVGLWLSSGNIVVSKAWAVILLASALFANCLNHIILSIATQSWMPGVLSAAALMGPLALILFLTVTRKLKLGWTAAIGALGLGAALQFIVPLTLIPAVSSFLNV